MKKGNIQGIFITIMIVAILAMVALSVSWGLIRGQLDTNAITNDAFTSADNGSLVCTRILDTCFSEGTVVVTNATNGALATGNFTECGTGNDLFGLTTDVECPSCNGATFNATYTQESCTPITGITGTMIDYIPLLMAIVLLAFVGSYAMKS